MQGLCQDKFWVWKGTWVWYHLAALHGAALRELDWGVIDTVYPRSSDLLEGSECLIDCGIDDVEAGHE